MLEILRAQFPPPQWPTLQAVQTRDEDVLLHLWVPAGLTWFHGHFPQQAVLPGVVQTHWALCLARHFFQPSQAFSTLLNLKFVTMVLPDTALQLELKSSPGAVSFSYSGDGQQYSSGKFVFQGAPA